MKKIFIASLFVLVCCNDLKRKPDDEFPKIESSFRNYFNVKMTDGTKIDSLKILRLDTLTSLIQHRLYLNKLLSNSEALSAKMRYNSEIIKLENQKLSLHRSLFGNNDAITKMTEDDVKKAKLDAVENIEKANSLLAQIDSIQKIISSRTLDSLTTLGYRPVFFIQLLTPAGSLMKADTIAFIMDKKYRILEQ